MKRKLLFLVSLISTSMVLTACGGLGEGGEGGGGNNSITLPNTAEEAVNMFYQFATTNGIEITYSTYDDESAQPNVNTVGFKNDTFWVKESVAYKKNGTNLEMYEYDASKQSYEFQTAVTETAQMSLDAMLKNFTAVFYAGYEYAAQGGVGSFTAKQDVTFLSRPATEYTFSYAALDAKATLKIVFDNATGITLKIYGSASGGEGSSSAEFEVTSFAIGNAVRVPTLNKPSGQGGEGGGGQGGEGGGGQQDVDYFANKLLVFASHQNAALYLNSQLALFDDGKFELSFYESNYLVVKLGEYSVASNKVSATLSVKKVYKDRDQKYSAMNETLTLNYADGGYTLQVSASGKVNYLVSGQPPVHADIPEEGGSQTGEDAKYKVTETQWNAIIVNRGLISLTSNFTMVTANSGNQEKYEFDNGKVHYTSAVNEVFYEFTSLTSGYVYYKSNGQWKKGDADGMHQLFDDYIGILPVPYSKVSFNSDAHYYGCSSWTTVGADGQQDSYQNAYFYFEDSNLMKTSYKHWNIDYLYNFSKYSQTTVTLPEVGGGGQTDQNARYKITSQLWEDMILDAGLVGLDSNFTAMVRASDLPQGQQNKYEFDNGKIHCMAADGHEQYEEYTSESSGYTYSKNESGVWTKSNNTFGISSYMNSLGMLPLEFSQLTFNESTHEYELATFNDPYGGSVYASNIAISFVDNKLMKMSYTREGVYRETEFAKYGQTSVTLPEVGGGQQQTSKWPAEDIAAKLRQLGISVTIPNPATFQNIEESNLVSVTDTIPEDNSGLSIVITLNDATNARVVASNYIRGISGFTMDPDDSDPQNFKYVLYNTAKDTVITIRFSQNSPVVSLFVAKYEKPSNGYEEAVRAMQQVIGADQVIPNLLVDGATYSTSNYGTLFVRIAFPEGTDMEEALASVIGNISEQGFHYSPRFLGYVLPEKGDYSTVVTPQVYSATELSVKVTREDTSLSGYGITTLSESNNGNPPYRNWFYSNENEEESGYEYRVHYSNGENSDQISLHEGDYFFVYDFENEQHFYAAIDDRSLNGEFELYLEYDEEMGGFLVLQDFTAYFYLHIEMDNDMIYIKDVNAQLSQWEEACNAALEDNPDYVIPDLTFEGATGYVWNAGNGSIDVTLAEDTSMTDVIDSLNAKLSEAGFHYSARYGVFVKVDANATIGFSINEDNSISIYPGTADFAADDGGYGLIILAYDEAEDYYYNDGEAIGEINPSNENEYIVRYYFEEGTHFVIYDFSNETQFDVSINEASFGGNYEDYIEYDMDSNSFVVKQSFEADVYIQLSWGNDTIYIQLIVNE